MDQKTLDIVVRQVIEALRAQGLVVAGPKLGTHPSFPAGATRKAAAAPENMVTVPSFVAREHTAGGNEVLAVPGRKAARPAAAQPSAKLFVTAEMLAQRAAGSTGGTIALAHNEFLTPAAEDLAEIKHWTVQRGAEKLGTHPSFPGNISQKVDPSDGKLGCVPSFSVGLVTVSPSPSVDNLVASLRHDAVSVQSFNATDCWMRNLEAMCEALAGGQVRLGVLLAPFAADAMLLAGKCKGVRPVQGTTLAAVAAAARRFDANLLVIEHAISSFHEMRQMVRTFAAARQEPTYKALLGKLAAREGKA